VITTNIFRYNSFCDHKFYEQKENNMGKSLTPFNWLDAMFIEGQLTGELGYRDSKIQQLIKTGIFG